MIAWLEKNTGKHPMAVVDALKELTKRWPSIRFPGHYAQKVVDIQSGNYNAADHAAAAKQEGAEIQAGAALVAQRIGFSLPGMGKSAKQERNPQELNAIRNRLLDEFGNPG